MAECPGQGAIAAPRRPLASICFFWTLTSTCLQRIFCNRVSAVYRAWIDFATCDVLPLSDKLVDRVFHDFYNIYTRALAQIHPHAPGFCFFTRRDKHQEINGFDETVVFCEDHDYVLRGQRVGTFGILRAAKVPVSVRRLDRDGRLEIAVKYAFAEAHFMTLGPVRSNIFNYTFGYKKK